MCMPTMLEVKEEVARGNEDGVVTLFPNARRSYKSEEQAQRSKRDRQRRPKTLRKRADQTRKVMKEIRRAS